MMTCIKSNVRVESKEIYAGLFGVVRNSERERVMRLKGRSVGHGICPTWQEG